MSTQLKASLPASNTPTQSAWYGAKTTTPLGVMAARENFELPLTADAIDELQVKLKDQGGGGEGPATSTAASTGGVSASTANVALNQLAEASVALVEAMSCCALVASLRSS